MTLNRTLLTSMRLIDPAIKGDDPKYRPLYDLVQKSAAKATSLLVPKIRRNPADWGIDQLPYTNRLEIPVRKALGSSSPDPQTFKTVCLATYLTLQNMRKRGELFTKAQPASRTRKKPTTPAKKGRGKAARSR